MWYNKYIGLPYKDGGRDTEGLDCWGLVRLVYKDKYEIDLPSFTNSYTTTNDREHLHELIARHKEYWELTTEPEEGSVVLMRVLGTNTHVGIYLGNSKFLHIRENTQAVVESIDSSTWKHRIIGYFKYKEKFTENLSLIAVPNPLKTEKIVIPVIAGTDLQTLAAWIKQEYQSTDKLISKSIFMVNGRVIPEVDWEITKLKENDSVEYRALAQGGDTFRMIAFLALAIYAPVLAGSMTGYTSAAAAAGVLGTTVTTGLTLTYAATYGAVLLAGSALINAIAPIRPPADPRSPVESVAQQLISGAQNQGTPYNPIPVVLGKMRITPPIGATNFVSFSGSEQIQSFSEDGDSAGVSGKDTYIDMLLIWGYGPLDIDHTTLRIGQVQVYKDASLTSTNYDGFLLQTLDRQTEPTAAELQAFNAIYGRDVQELFPNQPLIYEGLPPIGAGGPWTPQPKPTGDTGWFEAGFTQNTEQVSISIQFPQGLRATIIKGKSAGESTPAPVQFEIDYRYGYDNNFGTWQKTWGTYTVGGKVSSGADNALISGGVYADGFTWTLTKDRAWPVDAQVQVRVRRVTGDETEPNDTYRYSHAATLYSLTSYNNSSPAIDPPNTKIAKTALTIKATGEINGQIDGINAIVQTVCKDWDTGTQTWITRATSNPASLYRYVLQHAANPQPVLDSQLDLPQIQHWHEYCNTNRSVTYNGFTYTGVKLEYNSVMGGNLRSVLDVLRDIGAAGRASPAMLDGKWTVVIDEPKATIVQHFTPHNSWGFEATKLLPRMPEALKVQFNDRASDYVQKEIIVGYVDKDVNSAQLLESIQLPGVTSTAEAVDHAMWHLAQIKARPEVYTINTDVEYIVCSRGDRVKVTHDVPMWGSGSARIKNAYGTTVNTYNILEFDEEFEIDTSKSYNIRVRSSSSGSSNVYSIATSFPAITISRTSNIVTVTTGSIHPISVGDTVIVSTTNTDVNTTTALVDSVIFNTNGPKYFTYTLAGPDIVSTTVTGNIILTSNYYKMLRLATSAQRTDISPGDLVLFGELNKESQDLIVTKIEPSSNSTAKITLVDYGVSSNYNIFNNYPTTSSDTVFVANITRPSMNLINQVGNRVPIVDPAKAISDDSVMIRTAPGIYEYVIKVFYYNAPDLSNDIGFVVAEVIPADAVDTTGGRLITEPITTNSITINKVQEGSEYRYRLRYLTKSGKLGIWTPWYTHIVQGKLINFDKVDTLSIVKSKRYLNITPYLSVIPQNFKYFEVRVWKDAGTGDFWDTEDASIKAYTSSGAISVDLRDFEQPRLSVLGTQYRVACRILDNFGNYSSISTLGNITIETIHP